MKTFLKIIGSLLAVFGAVIGALAIFDKISNKNRIKGDYEAIVYKLNLLFTQVK